MGLFGHLLTREGSSVAVPAVPQACKAADAGLINPRNIMWVFHWATHRCPLSRCPEASATSFCGSISLQSSDCHALWLQSLFLNWFYQIWLFGPACFRYAFRFPLRYFLSDIFSRETRWQKVVKANAGWENTTRGQKSKGTWHSGWGAISIVQLMIKRLMIWLK